LVLCTDAASAATITVTTGGDTVGTASTCTLRQAIASANNDNAGASNCVTGSGADTIQFAAALADSTITLAQGQLSISTPVTITGSNQTIDANYQSRIFQIDSVVTASNLTLRHGYSSGAQGYSGGAINAFNSTLSLSDVVIDHNKTASYGGGLQVYHTTLDMTDVTISNNRSTATKDTFYTGGGININGNSTVTMTRAKITGNAAKNGAAIYTSGSTSVTVIGSTISGNTASAYGSVLVTDNSGTVSFIDTTISGNSAVKGGGLIVNPPSTSLYLANVTMSGNDSPFGSALLINSGTQSTVTNTTISGNTAATGGAGIWMAGGTVSMANTILSENTNSGNAALDDLDLAGGTLTVQYSVLGTALDVAPYNSAVNHNVFNNTPGLGALANNGGNVQTRALLSGSSALNAGSDALAIAPDGSPLAYDARGLSYVRTFGTVDIGAYEAQGDRLFASGFEALP
jgi:CSLREA domain-containing protein